MIMTACLPTDANDCYKNACPKLSSRSLLSRLLSVLLARDALQGIQFHQGKKATMSHLTFYLIGVVWLSSFAACSSARHVPQPVLERSDGTPSLEDSIVSQDLHTCRVEAQKAAPVSMQPRWLPPLGPAANGVVLGTAEPPHPVWRSRQAFQEAIERCLTDRGYKIRGWQ
jgi:hypothetical protein